jgi:hypothetical protein
MNIIYNKVNIQVKVKVKLFLCLTKHYDMKAYSEVDVQTKFYWPSH